MSNSNSIHIIDRFSIFVSLCIFVFHHTKVTFWKGKPTNDHHGMMAVRHSVAYMLQRTSWVAFFISFFSAFQSDFKKKKGSLCYWKDIMQYSHSNLNRHSASLTIAHPNLFTRKSFVFHPHNFAQKFKRLARAVWRENFMNRRTQGRVSGEYIWFWICSIRWQLNRASKLDRSCVSAKVRSWTLIHTLYPSRCTQGTHRLCTT